MPTTDELLLQWESALAQHLLPATQPLPDIPLSLGDCGQEVRLLQRALRCLGYALIPDGRYGLMTRNCLRSFQGTHGLPGTGAVDGNTWHALATACTCPPLSLPSG